MPDSRVALVTGASSGIGRAAAEALAAAGWRVFGASRREPARPGQFTFLPVDVREDSSVQECVRRVLQDAGRVDALVNCAGVVVAGSAEEMLPEETRDQIQTNLLGTMRMCRAVLPAMRRQSSGLLINVGSIAGLIGVPFQSAYSASKAGIEGYSESLQVEVRRFGIRVVVVDPGDIDTEITQHRSTTRGLSAESAYRRDFERAMSSQAASEKHGWSVDRMARVIVRIASSRRPRFRYTPGPLVERLGPVLRRLIPNRLFHRLLAGFYGMT